MFLPEHFRHSASSGVIKSLYINEEIKQTERNKHIYGQKKKLRRFQKQNRHEQRNSLCGNHVSQAVGYFLNDRKGSVVHAMDAGNFLFFFFTSLMDDLQFYVLLNSI